MALDTNFPKDDLFVDKRSAYFEHIQKKSYNRKDEMTHGNKT